MHLPSYSIGDKIYNKISEICETYGTKVEENQQILENVLG